MKITTLRKNIYKEFKDIATKDIDLKIEVSDNSVYVISKAKYIYYKEVVETLKEVLLDSKLEENITGADKECQKT